MPTPPRRRDEIREPAANDTTGAWHDLVIELRGRTITAAIDGSPVLTHQTNAGDPPKHMVQLDVGNGSRDVMNGWFDDVRFEPLETTVSGAPAGS